MQNHGRTATGVCIVPQAGCIQETLVSRMPPDKRRIPRFLAFGLVIGLKLDGRVAGGLIGGLIAKAAGKNGHLTSNRW